MSRPVGRIVAKPKDGGDLVACGSLWEPPFHTDKTMYSLMLGNKDPKYGPSLEEVLDILGSGDYFVNVYINDEDRDELDD